MSSSIVCHGPSIMEPLGVVGERRTHDFAVCNVLRFVVGRHDGDRSSDVVGGHESSIVGGQVVSKIVHQRGDAFGAVRCWVCAVRLDQAGGDQVDVVSVGAHEVVEHLGNW